MDNKVEKVKFIDFLNGHGNKIDLLYKMSLESVKIHVVLTQVVFRRCN